MAKQITIEQVKEYFAKDLLKYKQRFWELEIKHNQGKMQDKQYNSLSDIVVSKMNYIEGVLDFLEG